MRIYKTWQQRMVPTNDPVTGLEALVHLRRRPQADDFSGRNGDRVIRHVAQVIRACIKGSDLAGRYGGEEFAILLPNTPVAGAGAVAEHIRAAVQKSKIRRPDRDEIVGNITISIGVATCTGKFVETDLLVGADTALYAAKKLGRNRVYTAPSTPG